jgi:hypothetical protein
MPANEPRAAVLLDEVHAALLRKDYEILADLGAALGHELDQPSQKLDAAALAIIRRKADRNAATLTAVQRGIRAALRRITDIRLVSNGMTTYDRSGRKYEDQSGSGLAERF